MAVLLLKFLFTMLTTGWCSEMAFYASQRNILLSERVDFSVLLDSIEDVVCVINHGDGDCATVLNEDDFIVEEKNNNRGAFGDFFYKKTGRYIIEIVCKQGVNSALKMSENVTLHEELSKVRKAPEQRDKLVPLFLYRGRVEGYLNFTLEKGTSIAGDFITSEGLTGKAYIDEVLRMGYVAFKTTDFIEFGVHSVHVSVYNFLNNSRPDFEFNSIRNNETITYKVIYEKALNVHILGPNHILINTTATFATEQSIRETCIWLCSESVSCAENKTDCNMSHTFTVLGKHNVTVTVKNEIQAKNATKVVHVLVPVTGFTVSLESLNHAGDKTLILHRESNDMLSMGTLHADLSNEKCIALKENIQIPEFQDDFILLNIPNIENQTIRILISSQLSSQELFINIPMNPKFPVPEFSIHNSALITIPDGYERFEISLQSNASISTDINCKLDFKDTSPLQTISMSNLATHGVGHVFLMPGFHQVDFVCKNAFSLSERSSMINVKAFKSSDFEFHWPHWLSRNFSEIVTVFKVKINLFGLDKIPPGVNMEWRFGDGQGTSTSLLKWTQQHAYFSRGEYNISVSVSTSAIDVHLFHLPVRIGVLNFGAEPLNGISHTKAISFMFSGMVGRKIECILWFGDTTSLSVVEGKNFSNETPIRVIKMYERSGVFTAELLCWSDLFVEHVRLSSTIKITDPIANVSLHLQPQIAYPDGIGKLKIESFLRNTIWCKVFFGDGTLSRTIEVNPRLSNPKTVNHTFQVIGKVTVVAYCTTDNVTYVYFSNKTHIVSNCFGSSEPLSNLDSVVKSVVSERVVIAAKPEIRCLNVTTEFLWKIEKNGLPVDMIQPNATLLVLPPRTMEPGTYRILFYVNLVEMPDLFISDSVNLIYSKTPLQAKIKGGNHKNFGYDQPIVLDAITDSYDPDVERGNDSGLFFRWTCSLHGSEKEAYGFLTSHNTKASCKDPTIPNKGLVVVASHCLQRDKWYLFQVTIRKDRRTTSNYQLIHITGIPLLVDLRVNCLEKVNAEFSLSLESECLDCSQYERRMAQYSWKLYRTDSYHLSRENVNNLQVLTTTGTNISSISIQRNSFQPGAEYTLELTIWIGQNRFEQILEYNFIVNLPPYNGTCSLFPSQGVAVHDEFQVTCSGWLDEGYRKYRSAIDDGDFLLYDFFVGAEEKKSLLFSGGSRQTSWQELNAGRAEDNYTVLITVRIFDRHKGLTQTYVTGKVTPYNRINTVPIPAEELDVTITDLQEQMAKSLVGRDIHSLSRTLEATSSILNKLIFPNVSTSLPEKPSDWLQDVTRDARLNQNGLKWKRLWKELTTREIEPQKAKVKKIISKFCRDLSSSVNITKPLSLSAVHMISSVVDSKIGDHRKLESISNVLEILGNYLNVAMDTEKSDVQVIETMKSVVKSIGDTMVSIYTEDPVLDKIHNRKDAKKCIDKVKSYSDTVQLKNATDKMTSSDLLDEERLFLLTRASISQQHLYRKQQTLAYSNFDKLLEVVKRALDLASSYLVEGQEPATFTGQQISASVEKAMLRRLHSKRTVLEGFSVEMSFPDVDYFGDFEVDDMQRLIQQTIVYNKNPFIWNTEHEESYVTSPVLHIRLLDENNDDIEEIRNIPMIYKIKMPQANPVISTISIPLDWGQMLYHKTELRSSEDNLILYIRPFAKDIGYDVFLRSESFPTSFQYDFHTYVEFRLEENLALKSLNCPPGSLPRKGTVYIGLQPRLLKGKMPTEASKGRESPLDTVNASLTLQTPYDFGVISVGCKEWDDILDQWNPRLCQVEETHNVEEISCHCEQPLFSSLTVGTSFYVPLSTTEFSTVFTQIDSLNNASVLGTVGGLFVVYCIVSLWTRRKDKKDMLKRCVTSLKDNLAEDSYRYLLTVHTGMRLGSDTESNIGFIISGVKYDTGMRLLSDGINKGLERQTIVHYLMTVPACLGDLQYVRIWHDNSGKGSRASWFLYKFLVEDIKLNKRFVFCCNQWLALDKDDGRIDRLLPVSGNQIRNFGNLFYDNIWKNVSDQHLWLSVVLRPHNSSFTRLQRLSCCLSLLYLTMISNAIFYHSETIIVRRSAVNVGILRLSTHQIYISVIGLLIAYPINALIVWLFTQSHPGCRTLPEVNKYSIPESCDAKMDRDKEGISVEMTNSRLMKSTRSTLPHFCIYIAWGLLVMAIVTSAFFLILFSQQWGKTKSEEWLTSFILSFFVLVLILDPLKVLCVALMISLFIRKPGDNSLLDMSSLQSISVHLSNSGDGSQPPLPESQLAPIRTANKKKTEAFSVVKEIVLYLLCLMVVYTLAYANRDHRSFDIKNNIYNMMVYKQKNQRLGFDDVRTTKDFFIWLNGTALPALFQDNYSDGSRRTHWDRYLMSDLQSFRVGPLRLRQIRTAQLYGCEHISIPYAFCNTQYHIGYGEEERDFCFKWKDPPCPDDEVVTKFSSTAWQFTSSSNVWGMPVVGRYNTYSGGGYIAQMDVNTDVSMRILKELFEGRWVDRMTRAVALEFTIYNANVNIFCYVGLMVEFPETGGVIKYALVAPFRVYPHVGALGTYILCNEILFLLFLLIAFANFVTKIKQFGISYLDNPWHIVDFVYIMGAIVGVGLYWVRADMTKKAISLLHDDRKQFVNFHHIAMWDRVLVNVIGILSASVTIRTINILGYNRRVSGIWRVLTNAGRELLCFTIIFFIVFVSFVILGYMLFGTQLEGYQTVLLASAALMNSITGNTPVDEMRSTQPLLAPLYFLLFVFLVVVVLLGMFITILKESSAFIRSLDTEDPSQNEMLKLLIHPLLEWLRQLFPSIKRYTKDSKDIKQTEGREKDSIM